MARFEVKNLSVGYEKPLLREISFCTEPGQMVGILGRNGCGKTTLLRGLAGSVRRFSGEIVVSGKNCAAMNPRQQAAYLSVLPQQTQILEGILARDVIEMGRYPHGGLFPESAAQVQLRVIQAADTLGIARLLTMDCGKLSQGQRQLVLLARCLVQDTPVLLLDEPNTALDYDNTHTLFRTLRDLVSSGGKTALMVLHDPELALQYCQRLLILKDGKLMEDLTVAQAGQQRLERALQGLYPNIVVRKDPLTGRFRCYDKEELSKENRPC